GGAPAQPADGTNGAPSPSASVRATKKAFDDVTGDREGEAARDHGGDSDDAAAGVDQGPAGIARLDAHVSLHPGRASRPAAAPDRMNDARGQRPRSPEGVAAGKNQVAWPQARGVADRRGGEEPRVDLDHGEVALRVPPTDVRLERALIGKHDGGETTGDVGIGDDVAVGAPDDSRTVPCPPAVDPHRDLMNPLRQLREGLAEGEACDAGGLLQQVTSSPEAGRPP